MRDFTARDAAPMFDMTGYVEFKRLLTKVEVIEESMPGHYVVVGTK